MTRFPIVPIYIVLLLSSCGSDKKSGKAPGKPQTYSELTLEPRSATIFNDFPATIEGIEIVQLRPMVDGYLEKIYAKDAHPLLQPRRRMEINPPTNHPCNHPTPASKRSEYWKMPMRSKRQKIMQAWENLPLIRTPCNSVQA